jgi:hypothetical protein
MTKGGSLPAPLAPFPLELRTPTEELLLLSGFTFQASRFLLSAFSSP